MEPMVSGNKCNFNLYFSKQTKLNRLLFKKIYVIFRASKIAEIAKIDFEILEYPEDKIPNLHDVEKYIFL